MIKSMGYLKDGTAHGKINGLLDVELLLQEYVTVLKYVVIFIGIEVHISKAVVWII